MELPRRAPDDVYVPEGAFAERVAALRQIPGIRDLAIGIVYAFDFRTRMLPFWYADKRMAPCSVRVLGDVLSAAGFSRIRIVLQQWTPNVLPSCMRLDGRPLDILLISAMQVHAEPAYALIRDAHALGEARPLIIAGGPKAIYEPTDFLELDGQPGVGADCVVTGEAFVLLDLLKGILADRPTRSTARGAFERARVEGRLAGIPGLVYLSPHASSRHPAAVSTGVQRLLRDLDELPLPDAGFRMLESPHRRKSLDRAACPARRVGRLSTIASVVSTQGCRFNCSYCPIPAVNQRTWRHKSPARLAQEIRHIFQYFGICHFFSTDDNFFNDRKTVVELMTALSETKVAGAPLAERIRFYTEATEFDVYKNRDLLPLCRKGGLAAIWFGIEDITAELVNKGQTAGKTRELFALLHKHDIEPMTMMIHSDQQPLKSRRGELTGLLNQARYLFKQGAVSYQCTYLGPAVGTRDFEPAAKARAIYKRVGGKPVPQAYQDGNHVVASRHPRPWQQQFNVLRAYATFYNPVNLLRTLLRMRADSLGPRRVLFQVIGQIGLLLTAPKMLRWAWKLRRGPIEVYPGLQAARIPLIDVASGKEINWAIEHTPAARLRRGAGERHAREHVSFTANSLATRLGGTIEGDGTIVIRTAATLEKATPESISWVADRRHAPSANGSSAGVILIGNDDPQLPGRTVIRVPDPEVALVQVLEWLAPPRDQLDTGVDPSARIHPEAEVLGATIGANVYVAAGAVIGAGTRLHPGVYVGALARIGHDCELWPNVVVRERVTIGDRVTVHPNTTLGADGFGYLQRNGAHLKIPQIGTVVVEDDVEIGANCAVDRARTGITRIGRGTKIDNLVQIAHNVDVGPGCIIVAQCGIAGSTTLGERVMLGGQVGLSDHIRIGAGARIAAKSAVFKDVGAGETVRGIPATENQRFLRHEAGVRQLPKWVAEVKALRRRIGELETLLARVKALDIAPDQPVEFETACPDRSDNRGFCNVQRFEAL